MPVPAELGPLCVNKQPLFYMDSGLAWEERLARAYDEATKHLRDALPAGTVLNTSQYELSSQLYGSQYNAKGSAWLPYLQQNKDIPQDAALTMEGEQMRQFYLGKYASASSNLGAYLTGYAREQIAAGSLSQKDFDEGAEARLRSFSEIIYLGRTGQLRGVVGAEPYAAEKGGGDGSGIFVGTNGTTISAGSDISGLGIAPAIVIGVAIVAALAIVGTVAVVMWSNSADKTKTAMLELCQEAIRKGDPKRDQICRNMADSAAKITSEGPASPFDAIFGKGAGKVLVYGAVAIGGLALLAYGAPFIAKQLEKTRESYAQEKARSLARAKSEAEAIDSALARREYE